MPDLTWSTCMERFSQAMRDEVLIYITANEVQIITPRALHIAHEVVLKWHESDDSAKEEFSSLQAVRKLCNSSQVRVPLPLLCSTTEGVHDDAKPFILVEHLDGETVEGVLNRGLESVADLSQNVFDAIYALHQQTKNRIVRPGPPSELASIGFPWANQSTHFGFRSLDHLELVLRTFGKSFDTGLPLFVERDLMLCHMELAPRNILLLNDGTIAFLDWTSAGNYPAVFELAAMQYISEVEDEGCAAFMQTVLAKLQDQYKCPKHELEFLERIEYRSINLGHYELSSKLLKPENDATLLTELEALRATKP